MTAPETELRATKPRSPVTYSTPSDETMLDDSYVVWMPMVLDSSAEFVYRVL